MSESKPTLRRKTLDLARHPGRWFTHPARKHYRKKYHGRYKYPQAVFVFDLILIGIAIGLGLIALFLAFYKPTTLADKVIFEATVAPREVVAGAPSTLVIRWTNLTGEELEGAKLLLGYPEHFLLQEVATETGVIDGSVIDLGTIPVDGQGQVKIRGVMFGNVGGDQTFRSILSFRAASEERAIQKVSYHTFQPVASTLALELELPERLVAYQEMSGMIKYKNTGEIDFPEISVEPIWPEGFTLLESSTEFSNGSWRLPAIEAGTEGEMSFTGRMDTELESVEFVFHPFFTFGLTNYQQESLHQIVPFIPPPVKLSHSIDSATIRPGSNLSVTVQYENTSEFEVSQIEIRFDSDSPFFRSADLAKQVLKIDALNPGETGTGTLTIPVRSSILQSETTTYTNLSATTNLIASYVLGDGAESRITSAGSEITTAITSPIVLESFGRYSSPQGDQLGRGPIPPYVGEETKYWIFVNIRGTTNPITNVSLEGQLPAGVRFTGKQTVSRGDSISYDSGSNTISWSISRIEPTFAPGSYVIGLAFEVGVTPSAAQVGTSPSLLSNIRITGTDANTGGFVSASGASVSTNLPNDAMAAGLGVVQQ